MTVLDGGSGPGFASLDLAKIVGTDGKVIALEREPKYLDHVRELAAQNGLADVIEAREGDLTKLALPEESIDAAHLRFLLVHTGSPKEILSPIAQAIKSGGTITLMELTDYQDVSVRPDSEIFNKIWKITEEWVASVGGDLNVGGKLSSVLEELGFEDIQVERIVKVGNPGSEAWSWIDDFTGDHIARLKEEGRISEREAAEYLSMWAQRTQNPDSVFSSWPTLAITARKK